MIPKYITRMTVAISGAKASPKSPTRSDDATMPKSAPRKRYALINVKANIPIPIINATNPMV